jgi:dipeptide/tripeptide permease
MKASRLTSGGFRLLEQYLSAQTDQYSKRNMAKQRTKGSLQQLELFWWLITGLVLAAVLLPIYFNIGNFPFYRLNIVVIICFITLGRYIFLLPYTFIARREVWKIVIVFLCIPLVFYLVQELNYFQTFIDERGVESLVGKRPADKQMQWVYFIQNEILLFGVGAVIATVIMPFRLILSVWRGRNRGTV